jgi:ATP-dependent Lon protease
MFVNNATGQRGLVCQYDVVCFDEVSGVSFDQKDGVNIMKGYMESGEFSRGKESIRADGCIVLVGNFDVDVEHQQRVGHLFGPLPRRCATTPPSWTASTPTCRAGTCRR